MFRSVIATAALIAAVPALATPQVGKPAPSFAATDATGKTVRLSDYRGKTVVLEWTNPLCPFVVKHYSSGNMQRSQAAAQAAGVVWLTVNSSAPGKQGHLTGPQALAEKQAKGMHSTAYLLDHKGLLGRGYDAKTTPHMYVIDGTGTLVYAGGIDDKPTANVEDIKGARNHVLAAIDELKAGKSVSVPTSKPYGCSVKYDG